MRRPILKFHLVDVEPDADDGNVHHIGFDGTVDEDASQFVVFIVNVVWPFYAEF